MIQFAPFAYLGMNPSEDKGFANQPDSPTGFAAIAAEPAEQSAGRHRQRLSGPLANNLC
jgi:hypothetical protein